MKKVFALVLSLVLALSLAACGGGEKTPDPAPASTPASSSEPAPAPASSAEEETVDWESILDYAHMGVSEAGEYYYLGLNEAGDFAVLCILSESGDFVSFVGEATDNGEGSMTISDEQNGLSLTFTATALDDGTIELDLGEELGYAVIAPCEVSELAEALNAIDAGGNAVA